MTSEQFQLAQDAANAAYDMTMEQTGDKAQAAADYAAVMQAYNDAQQTETKPGWFANTEWTLDNLPASVIAQMEARCAETASGTEEMIALTRRIWRETKSTPY